MTETGPNYEAANGHPETRDDHHTMEEMYAHRHALMLLLMSLLPARAWMARVHDDGTNYEGWFIVGLKLEGGDITYHLPDRHWVAACNTGATITGTGHKWDGHTSDDVVSRLMATAQLITYDRVSKNQPEMDVRPLREVAKQLENSATSLIWGNISSLFDDLPPGNDKIKYHHLALHSQIQQAQYAASALVHEMVEAGLPVVAEEDDD